MRVAILGLMVAALACAAPVDFEHDVQPLFAKRCWGCHGAQQQMKGLRLDDRDSAMKVIVPGNSAASTLMVRVSSTKKGFAMPPIGAPLTEAEIANLGAWIDAGAKWPATAAKAVSPQHWSFIAVHRPATPDVRNRAWVRNPIDAFVLAKLESENIEPSPQADRRTLLRRVSYDLTGLPPTPAEVDAFLADNRPDAYERVVDGLLASPHYGERWARHWLDLAHYADSDGYEKDRGRPWAWRYRQWVIEALNRDMPFDEFTIEQLAGDLLPDATVEQRVATGFLRNTLTNREAGVDRAEARFEQIVNRTNTVSTTWLGLTVGCAQCHNHKFDPISHKDYYSMFAFFENAEEQNIDAPLPGEVGPYLEALPEYRAARQKVLAEYKIPELEATWEAKLKEAYANQGRNLEWDFQLTEFRAGYDGERKVLTGDAAKRSRREQDRLIDYFVDHIGPDFGKDKTLADSLKAAREKLEALTAALPQYTQAPVMETDPSIPPSHIHLGGDYKNVGDPVEPNTLAVLPPLPEGAKHDRLALARWLVSRANPLTARVTVNRMWQEFFGTGLVRTSEDFGTQGEAPTHPELLDWLASELVDRGWSMKQMHRMIVTSAAYRQSSHTRKELESRDPENRLIARQARLRLPAEEVRDAALSVSGLLNPEIGGRSVKPAQPKGVAELGYANSVKWVESKGMDRYRRGLYIHYQRTTPYPLLSNFDAPDSNTTCTRRRRSNTPLQALNLLNDPVFFEAAQALARRVLLEDPQPQTRLDYAFELCLGRPPQPRERERLSRYLDSERTVFRADEKSAEAMLPIDLDGTTPDQRAAWVAASRVLLNLDEFITRE